MELSHIHPMFVHFPIVLWLLTAASMVVVAARREHFAQRSFWPRVSLWLVSLGTLGGIVAASFGDMASDIAREKGFPTAPIEHHEELALTTLWIFIFVTAVQLFLYWRRIELTRGLTWLLTLVGVIGAILVLVTAYYGGHLVYDIGVNVNAVKPG